MHCTERQVKRCIYRTACCHFLPIIPTRCVRCTLKYTILSSNNLSPRSEWQIAISQSAITKISWRSKISWRDSLHRWKSAISHGSRRPQTKTAGAHQWEKPVVSSRQRGKKPQRKNAGGRMSKQHPYHPHPKPSSVQSVVGGAHQESVSTATNNMQE